MVRNLTIIASAVWDGASNLVALCLCVVNDIADAKHSDGRMLLASNICVGVNDGD